MRKVIRQKTVENVNMESERKKFNKAWSGPGRETEMIKT